jgi:hypothetical protein
MPRIATPKAIKAARKRPEKLRAKPYTRSEIFDIDLYVNETTGGNTLKNQHLMRLIHAQTLNAKYPRALFEDDEDTPKEIEADDVALSYHICDSYDNPGVYCAYDDVVDPSNDFCCYCGQPDERK